MSLFGAFEKDRDQLLESYRLGHYGVEPLETHAFPLHLFEWKNDKGKDYTDKSVDDLSSLKSQDAAVRVIFAPPDVPERLYVRELVKMFERCNIPSAFISESLANVSQSFGTSTDVNGTMYLWFHFLSKDIGTVIKDHQMRVVHPIPARREDSVLAQAHQGHQEILQQRAQQLSQANFIWTKTGVVLRIEKVNDRKSNVAKKVTMYCFGAPNTFLPRFQRLRDHASRDKLLEDPHMLLGPVIEEMYKLLDGASWSVARSFGSIETETLQTASKTPPFTSSDIDFTGLHNLSKHTIYLLENLDSALSTLSALIAYHRSTFPGSASDSTQKAEPPSHAQITFQQFLNYHKTLFESTKRRLTSLDSRMHNIIALSFHLVTQSSNLTIQSESKSMKTIAVMTLFFMPLGTVASVFGSEFFVSTPDTPFRVSTSQDLWWLWAVAGPLTIVVVVVWRFWYWDARAALIGKMPGVGARHVYRGAKSIGRWVQERRWKRKGKSSEEQVVELYDLS